MQRKGLYLRIAYANSMRAMCEYPQKGGITINRATERPTTSPPVTVREYEIGGTKYIVRATVKDGANEDATSKIRRLIRNEISRTEKNNS